MQHVSGTVHGSEPPQLPNRPFSDDLSLWLKSNKPKTINSLNEVFAEKSFAVIFLVFMALPALPVPTGFVTSIFELAVMILCLEMLVGKRAVWLPRSLAHRPLGKPIIKKGLPYLVNKIRWLERFARPRMSGVVGSTLSRHVHALIILILTIFSFIAPPFSGLDTLPALGVVIISLGIILEDIAGTIIGTIVGAIGITLTLGLARAFTSLVS